MHVHVRGGRFSVFQRTVPSDTLSWHINCNPGYFYSVSSLLDVRTC